MSYQLIALWISPLLRNPMQTVSFSPAVPASWRGLVRVSRIDAKSFIHGRLWMLALSTS